MSSETLQLDRIRIAGVPVDVVTETDVLKQVERAVETGTCLQISTVNAEFVVRARADPTFADVLERAGMTTPDGAGVVYAMRRAGIRQNGRVGGSDLIYSISRLAAERSYRIFFLGAAPGVARIVASRLTRTYLGLIVAGTYSGSPRDDESRFIVDLIRRANADIVFVAFGAPQQELWISEHLPNTQAAVAIGVGGSFDYVAGLARRAPKWMRDHGLDWLWRLLLQPRRWRRMLALPRFVWLVMKSTPNHPKMERTEPCQRASIK